MNGKVFFFFSMSARCSHYKLFSSEAKIQKLVLIIIEMNNCKSLNRMELWTAMTCEVESKKCNIFVETLCRRKQGLRMMMTN